MPLGQAAAAARVAPRTVVRWVTTGRIPGYRVGRSWWIPAAPLGQFLADGRVPARLALRRSHP